MSVIRKEPGRKNILQERREEMKLTQEAAARQIGVSRATLAKAEAGKEIEQKKLLKILNFYKMTEKQYRNLQSGERIVLRAELDNERVYYHPIFDELSPDLRKCLMKVLDLTVEIFLLIHKAAIDNWEKEKSEGVEEVPHDE